MLGTEHEQPPWYQAHKRNTMNAAKSYEEIIDFIAAGTTPETVLAFRPSEDVQRRVAELVERSKQGSISAEEQSELDDYLQLEHIMIMAKARARQHTHLGQSRKWATATTRCRARGLSLRILSTS